MIRILLASDGPHYGVEGPRRDDQDGSHGQDDRHTEGRERCRSACFADDLIIADIPFGGCLRPDEVVAVGDGGWTGGVLDDLLLQFGHGDPEPR